jgi:hypothetical protein
MKKITFLFSLFIIITSCQKEVEFNNPSLQASINSIFWRSNSTKATKASNGSIELFGRGQSGDLTLKIGSGSIGTYELGTTNQNNLVSFVQTGNNAGNYSTGLNKNAAHQISLSTGGTGYTSSIAVPTTGGSGTGLKVATTANASGVITTIEIATSGTDYLPGDIVTISGGNQNAQLLITKVANSNGQITITENTGTTISGNFSFIAFDNVTKQTVSCRDGVFYKLPITLK